MGQKWPDCDSKIKEFVNGVVQVFKDSIPEKLEAVFLHGSLAMGSFYPPKSNIDLLIVVNSPLNLDEQKLIYARLIDLTDNRSITGFLELSVVLSDQARQPKHPIPYELHFGEDFPDKIRNGEFDYDKAKGNDPDLAAHFTLTKNRGIPLFGPPPKQILGDIPWQDYLDSVLDDLGWILDDKNILTSPFYGVLNCCRVLEMLEKGEGTVSSKEGGALWALDALPAEHHNIIRFALERYKSGKSVSSEQRQKAGVEWPEDKLLKFRDYVRKAKNIASQNYRLRDAYESDNAWLDSLRREVYRDLFFATWGNWDEDRHTRHFTSCLSEGNIQIIEINQTPIGMLQLFNLDDAIEISEIQISSLHQGKGLASQIISDILQKGNNSHKKVTLSTGLKNFGALKLYQKLGFKEVKRTEAKIYMEHNHDGPTDIDSENHHSFSLHL